jgi:hypothetical protein
MSSTRLAPAQPDWSAIAEASDRRNDEEYEHLVAQVRTKRECKRALEDVVGELADPVAERSARAPAPAPTAGDNPLATIPPPVYVELLTGRERGRDGKKVACLFHDDRTPSLEVYDDPARGWYCFGCERGGSIVDFGAALWEIEPRGAGYHEIRRRLEAELVPALRSAAA